MLFRLGSRQQEMIEEGSFTCGKSSFTCAWETRTRLRGAVGMFQEVAEFERVVEHSRGRGRSQGRRTQSKGALLPW